VAQPSALQMKDLTVAGKAHPDAAEVTMKRVK
jgi:hypothetical protein